MNEELKQASSGDAKFVSFCL